MGEGNIFTLCVSPHLDGGGGGRVPRPRSGREVGVTDFQVWTEQGGTLFPDVDGGGGVPHPRCNL